MNLILLTYWITELFIESISNNKFKQLKLIYLLDELAMYLLSYVY